LRWDPPTTYTDGAALAVAGYRLHYGAAPSAYTASIDVGSASTYTFSGLAAGTYYFSVTAYDAAGNESVFSNEVSKTIN
jgi:hypothetical protein